MTPSVERQAFGRRLRAERERRQIALDTIAATTKIRTLILARLEAGDASLLPRGVLGRGYVRQYAEAVGLPPESVIAEFSQLFEQASAIAPGGELRMTLARDARRDALVDALAIAAAVGEAAALVAAAGALALAGFAPFWPLLAVSAIGYYVTSNARLGRSPARWYFEVRTGLRRRSAAVERPHIVARTVQPSDTAP